ncbi:MAG: L,D-transpeptidase family protein, partial [Burkholderiales bacterium]
MQTVAIPAAATPMVEAIRAKLADPAIGKSENAVDLAALSAFYGARTAGPLWITEMGFSAKGQQALFEIGQAGDWGLDATAFDLPAAGELPASVEAQALAEIKLDLAILKYARYARGGRFTPSKVSMLFDQVPPLRDPKTVLAEIAAAEAPDAYLRSLHPKHEQFQRLREALLKARGDGSEEGEKPAANGKDIKRILINMERWRWLPNDLGSFYVAVNIPEFMLKVMEDGKPAFTTRVVVGKPSNQTPVFSNDMQTIVFNPYWNVPNSIKMDELLPAIRGGGDFFFGGGMYDASVFARNGLRVAIGTREVDPSLLDWSRIDIRS